MADISKITDKLEWKDISSEKSRTYFFEASMEKAVTIIEPQLLNVNPKSGGHRIISKDGRSWYIPAGWIALSWAGYEKGVAQYDF